VIRFLTSPLADRQGIQLKGVAVSHLDKPREVSVPRLTDEPLELIGDPDVDLIVELIGGESPARDLIQAALSCGKSVITANKAVISRHMRQLFDLAREYRVDLGYEASVAGAIPVIRVLQGFQGEHITRMTGILNGTCNYILSRMEEGMDFQSALSLAQEKGFAESEHELDTGGFDARDKLAIVSSLLYNSHVQPSEIPCQGITELNPVDLDFAAKHGLEEGERGYSVKSLATAKMSDRGLELSVHPALIRRDHPLASVRDETNGIYIEGELCGPQLLLGRGAGRGPTTSAVVSDILRLAKNTRRGVIDELPTLGQRIDYLDPMSVKTAGYVRMNLRHTPGSIAEASRILGNHGFNIEDSIQRRRFKTVIEGCTVIPDIVTVEALPLGTLSRGLQALQESDRILGDPFFVRFEE
jgi:homoserine dehydrogenase